MSAHYFYQIILCSGRPGRAFRREIAVSSRNAMVTHVEMLPPRYDAFLEQARDPGEGVYRFAGRIGAVANYKGCPFCGNSAVFECTVASGGCGALSCISADHSGHHCCPGCDRLQGTQDADEFPVSRSGFVDGDVRGVHRLDGEGSRPLPRPSDVSVEISDGRPPTAGGRNAGALDRQEELRRLMRGGRSGATRALPGSPRPALPPARGDRRDEE